MEKNFWPGGLIVSALATLIGYLAGVEFLFRIGVIYTPFWVVYWALREWLYIPWLIRRQYKAQRVGSGDRALTFKVSGMEYEGGNHHGSIDWSGFQSISENKTHFVLWLHSSSGIVIPKRVFESNVRIGQFSDFVRKKIAENRL